MKEIVLSQGLTARVDDDDYEYLNQWKWTAVKSYNTYYATRKRWIDGKQKHYFMHSVIMNPPFGMEVDHKDHNGLNNQKSNLRNGTHQQNQMNRRPVKTSSSKYLGVNVEEGKYIIAYVQVNKRKVRLGTFKTEEDAARAYDEAAKKHYGEFANVNFK